MNVRSAHTGAAGRGCGARRSGPLLLLALLVALGACGQKGTLYLPEKGKGVPEQSSAPRPATPQTAPSTQLPTLPPATPESQPPVPSQTPAPEQAPPPPTVQPPPDDSGS